MMGIQEQTKDGAPLSKYLSPLAAWALAFGSAVGWGAFVMPGTTFLPIAGPWGAVIGLVAGAAIMFIIGWCYCFLMKRYPDAGGSYTIAAKVLGNDHAFLCAWMLMLTYAAVIWANSTALSLIMRCLFGDVFCFGFSYQIAGYTVYTGEEDVRATENAAVGAARDFSGVRILLAEDNPINSEIATMILSHEGFTVDIAENGKRAVEIMEQADEDTYSAVLMDMQMPVMNGLDAARAIRALEGKRAQVPIIALTANTFESDRREAFEAGMNAHVAKPFQPDKLIATLAECIDTYSGMQ